jgi:hypothetical protein
MAQVDNHFILSSSVGLTREVIRALKASTRSEPATLLIEADGPELARLLELDRSQLVMQNMPKEGHDRRQAEEDIGNIVHLLRFLGRGRLSVQDGAEAVRFNLGFTLSE